MKKCSYCGGEFPDEAMACPIDQTPFEETQTEAVPLKFSPPTFALVSENKIPVSLIVVSYVFFLPAAAWFAFLCLSCFSFLLLTLVYGIHMSLTVGINVFREIFLWNIIYVPVAILCLCVSRGLRKCSRGWRMCALVLLWLNFAGFALNACSLVLHYVQNYNHDSISMSLLIRFFTAHGIYFFIWFWCYRVLARQNIRELFGVT